MAKIIYANALPNWAEIDDAYNGEGAFLNQTKKSAVWVDGDSGNQISLEGKGLQFKHGELVAGTVTKITFEDFEGADFATITGEFSAKKLEGLNTSNIYQAYYQLSAGNDKVIGTANEDYLVGNRGDDVLKGGDGNDIIFGGRGNDRMYGGDGADLFLFDAAVNNKSHDTIYDFDANGGGFEQDYLSSEAPVVDIRKSGHDTIVEFEDGMTVKLIDVKPSQITYEDFDFPV